MRENAREMNQKELDRLQRQFEMKIAEITQQNFRLTKENESLTTNYQELKKSNTAMREQLNDGVQVREVLKAEYETLKAFNKD